MVGLVDGWFGRVVKTGDLSAFGERAKRSSGESRRGFEPHSQHHFFFFSSLPSLLQ